MKNSDVIDGSIDFIESRLTETIDIGELAQQAFFSKTHYQRLFRAIVGEPVMEYVKNRRLQLACRDVQEGNTGILDIALKYGYGSHEGFTRAFKAYFGVTPSEYRKCSIPNETEVVVMLSNGILNQSLTGTCPPGHLPILYAQCPIIYYRSSFSFFSLPGI